ncbi:MAG: putative Ig domain-containing protein [Verrucomicrobiota bacterium]|nr:putative Ig domain-containing protein [Verrucomicrobiota bacterium]
MRAPRRVFFVVFVILSAVGSTAHAVTDLWQNKSLGDWFVASNWSTGVGVPTSSIDVFIGSGGTAFINAPSAQAQTLTVGAPTTTASTGSLLMGASGGTFGSLSVTSEIDVGESVSAGIVATGNLTVSAGAFLTQQSGNTYVGRGTQGSTGTLKITDVNSVMNTGLPTIIGLDNSHGNLIIQNSGTAFFGPTELADGAASSGAATVTGANSRLYATGGLSVGYAGNGTLAVSSGGSVVVQGPNNTLGDAAVAALAGSAGSVTVSGAGSQWIMGNLFLGGRDGNNRIGIKGGNSSLRIQSGGYVQAKGIKFFGGAFEVDNGSASTPGLVVTNSGQPYISYGGTLGDMVVGTNTAGRMEIQEFSSVVYSNRGYVGLSAGGNGYVYLNNGGLWRLSGSLIVANQGDGTLELRGHGSNVTTDGDAYIGLSANTVGNVIVGGSDRGYASLSVAGNLYLGGSSAGAGGSGVLRLENLSSVQAISTTVYSTGGLALGDGNILFGGSLTFLGGFIQFVLTDNTSFPNDFTLGSGGLLVFTSGHPSTLAGKITGTGGLTKGGSGTLRLGTLTLTGASNYTGPTAVTGGTLVVNGSITSPVTVGNGATLGGSGAVGAVTVNTGGIVSPGNSPGRLTVNGNYTQAAGANLNIELGGTTAGAGFDQVAVSGTASINGILNVSLVNGFRPSVGNTFQIISSSGESGNFSTINSSGFTVRSDVSATGVVLTVTSVVPGMPVITSPTSANGVQDAQFTYQITATESPTSYGATGLPAGLGVNPTTGLISGTPTVSGAFNVTISATNSVATGSAPLTLSVSPAPPPPTPTPTPNPTPPAATTLANISTRLAVQTGDNVLISGFIVTGSQPKKLIIRALGPSLPVNGALADPTLELYNSSGQLIAANEDWGFNANAAEIQNTGIAPTMNAEAALLGSLNPGAYTAIERGADGGTGIGLLEVYDLDRTVDSKLANISTRGLVQTGDDIMIGGFIIVGTNPQKVIIRALGPSLPVSNPLSDPTLELRDHDGNLIATNDNWPSDQKAEIEATGIPPKNPQESAIVWTLTPQAYTAVVRGANNSTGIALVEIYALN